MRVTLSVKLSLKNDRHREIVEALQAEGNVSGAIARILEYYYFERDVVQAQADNTEVLSAIAALSRKMDHLKVQQAATEEQVLPTTVDTPVEWQKIDPDESTPFLRGVKKIARPGMRLES
jgi:hypothetical protein